MNNRRHKRSTDPVTALHYQLAAVRREESLDALVLTDDAGCLVAGAGAWPVCEELAAYAPLLSEPHQPMRRAVSARVDSLARATQTVAFGVEGGTVILSCLGGEGDRMRALDRARAGVDRILAFAN